MAADPLTSDATTVPSPPPWMVPLLDRLDRLLVALERATPAEPSCWLGAAELANLLGVSERSVRSWEQLGQLPAPVRIGRLKKWNRAEVERHLAKSVR